MSARFTVADLAASGVLDVGRNRERLAEAAGMSHTFTPPGVPAAASVTSTSLSPPVQAREHDSTPAAPDLHALTLAVLGEERRGPYLEGEDATQSDIRWFVDQGTRAGKWWIVTVAVYNEVRVRTASKAELARNPALRPWHERQQRLAQVEGARTRMMGRRKGAPDLFLVNVGLQPARFGLIEVKFPPNKLGDEQEAWRDWCEAAGVDWALATHPTHREDVQRAFRAWGWL